jgi:hypothetical protein
VTGLLPGEYFLSFLSAGRIAYFSEDGSLSAATPVRLRAGQSLGCRAASTLELRVSSGIGQTHTISGQVVGALPKKVGDRFWVSLLWDVQSSRGGEAFAGVAKLDTELKFKLERVPKGRFQMQLHSAYGPEPMTWSGPYGPVSHLLATQSIEVSDDDVRDVKLSPMNLPSVRGFVHFENLPANWKNNFDVSSQSITLAPSTFRAPFSAKLSADGSFLIDPEDVDDYQVQINQLSPPLYIRSVVLDGREISGRYFHLPAGHSDSLDIFVSGDSGQVSASVVPDPSLPTPEPSISETCGSRDWPEPQLVLIPEPFPAETDQASAGEPRVFQGYRAGDAGHPILQALAVPPGHYRALAAEHLFQGARFGRTAPLTDDECRLWSTIAALGEPVTVQAGAQLEIRLQDKTVDIAFLAARLGVPLDSGLVAAP